jgi:predicted dinucleotide-binding enzyme
MNVVVVIGSGSLGQAIARRVGAGKHAIKFCEKMEASPGIEPGCKDLQSSA